MIKQIKLLRVIMKLRRELYCLKCEMKANKNSLEEAWNEIKQRNSMITFLEEKLREKASIEVPYSTLSFIVPNLYAIERDFTTIRVDSRPRAEYIQIRLTDNMKIKLFDELIDNGYIRKTADNKDGEIYEIKVVK